MTDVPATLPERQRLILASDLPKDEKLVLLTLSLYIGDNGYCWATAETLANCCSMSLRRCKAHLSSLTGKGIVASQRRRNQPAWRSVNWSFLQNQEVPPVARPEKTGSATATPRKCHPWHVGKCHQWHIETTT